MQDEKNEVEIMALKCCYQFIISSFITEIREECQRQP